MIGLGIHRARNLAEESNQELKAALDATLELTMSAMWEAFGRDVAGVARAGGVSVRGRREPGVGDGPGCAWLRGEAGELRRAAGHDGAVDGRVGLRLFGWSARKSRACRHSAVARRRRAANEILDDETGVADSAPVRYGKTHEPRLGCAFSGRRNFLLNLQVHVASKAVSDVVDRLHPVPYPVPSDAGHGGVGVRCRRRASQDPVAVGLIA